MQMTEGEGRKVENKNGRENFLFPIKSGSM